MDSLDECECCRGLRGHMRLKDALCEEFEDEFHAAQMECNRLQKLFKDVCWYNFETQCQHWNRPWPTSWPASPIALHGVRIEINTRNGRDRETGHFPIYFEGSIQDAPPLPPIIILTEMRAAAAYLEECRTQCSAPYDWAPGGSRYLELQQTTKVPTRSTQLISKGVLDRDERPRRTRRRKRNTMGGTA